MAKHRFHTVEMNTRHFKEDPTFAFADLRLYNITILTRQCEYTLETYLLMTGLKKYNYLRCLSYLKFIFLLLKFFNKFNLFLI